MEVESAESSDDIGAVKEKQQENGDQVNGLKNGYASDKHKSHHKSEHKDKHRDKDKHRSKDHKSRDKDKDKHSTSGSKDKERHSSSHKSSTKDKDKDHHRDKDKDRHRDDKDRDKDKKSSSSSKDKDRENKHRDKDKDREHKTSSSSKDKDRDRERHKDREGHDKDKHRSRDKDKDRHSSSSKDKHRDKDKHHSSSRDKERKEKRERESDELKPKQELNDSKEVEVKQETTEDVNVSAASSCNYNLSQFKDEPKEEVEEEEEEEEQPSQEEEEEEDEEQPSHEEEELRPKLEVYSDEDVSLSARSSSKKRKKVGSDDDYQNEEDDDEVPLSARKKSKKEKKRRHAISDEDEEEFEEVKPIKKEKKKKRAVSDDEEYDEFKTIKKEKKVKVKTEGIKSEVASPKKGGRKKKEEEEQEVWKWWEEEKKVDGTKWNFLEHKGPVFAPPYDRLPENVKFYYDGKEMRLSSVAEEVAGFYAKMLDHDYTTKDVFNNNFFKDWRKCMNSKEQATISDLKKCNFKPMHAYFMDVAEKNRNRTKEEKLALKEKNEEIIKEYGFCKIDGHKEKIGNFKIEPPGLFRGRGEHPKMGMLKKRVEAEHIIINCSKNSVIPKAPEGHKWKEVRHDSSVTWLASWTENVQNQVKYIMLNPSSKLKGEKDMAKYETARRLHKCIEKIRREYKDDWKSKEMRVRQRAVALYFIDRLALRAGNEKDEDQADTVGCCSLRVEHIELHEKKDDKEYVVCFDFLGKDSIRYYNEVPVEKRVFKNLQLFIENKSPGDDLFDRLNTSILNKHLNELLEGLTAKVFRTYNASITLQEQLGLLTNEDDSVSEKMLSYNRANRAVAILCNHQRSVPKSHDKSMTKLKEKIEAKKDTIKDAERQVKDAQRDAKHGSVKEKTVYDKKKKLLQRLREQLVKLEVQETDRDENKTIALGTSKLNYLDPRISVAWCKKYEVPIEKVYNKTQRDKFRWAIDMAGPEYVF